MHQLSELLADATEAIGLGYFRLKIHGGPSVYRERVCYQAGDHRVAARRY